MSAISQYPELTAPANNDLLVVYDTSANVAKRVNRSALIPNNLRGFTGQTTTLSGTVTDYTTLPGKVFTVTGNITFNFSPVPTETFAFTLVNAGGISRTVLGSGNTLVKFVRNLAGIPVLPFTLVTLICGEYPGFPGTAYILSLSFADNWGN